MQLSSAVATNLVQDIIAYSCMHAQITHHFASDALETSYILFHSALPRNVSVLTQETLISS